MGVIGFFKKLSRGTFELIPRNWTYIYLRLFQEYRDVFTSNSSILTAASVINANAYLDAGRLCMEDFDYVLRNAVLGWCGPVPSIPSRDGMYWHVQQGPPGDFSEKGEASYDLIVNYCVQYAAVLLSADTPRIDTSAIIDACVRSRHIFEDSIATLNQELSRGRGNSYIWNMAIVNAMELKASTCTTKFMLNLIRQAPEIEKSSQCIPIPNPIKTTKPDFNQDGVEHAEYTPQVRDFFKGAVDNTSSENHR